MSYTGILGIITLKDLNNKYYNFLLLVEKAT